MDASGSCVSRLNTFHVNRDTQLPLSEYLAHRNLALAEKLCSDMTTGIFSNVADGTHVIVVFTTNKVYYINYFCGTHIPILGEID